MALSPTPAQASIRSLLRRLGLEDKEIDVYLTLLPLKMARASVIAKAARQSRSHTYLLLRALEEKGLVSQIERGAIIHFVAEPPERLLGYVKDRAQELRELETLVSGALPMLSSLKRPLVGEPRVTLLHGLEGVRHVYRDVLTHEFVALFNPQIDYDAFGGNIMHILFGKGATFRGKDLLVNNDAAQRHLGEMRKQDGYEIRLLPPGVSFDADIICFDDFVAIFTFGDGPTVIRIENRDLANAVRTWHGLLWSLSTAA